MARPATSWCVAAGLAVLLVAGVAWWAGSAPYAAVGDGDPGALVAVGAPVLRLLAYLAATCCVGSLAFAACCTRAGRGGLVTAAAFGELRVAGVAGWVWAVAAALLVPFSAADSQGVALSAAVRDLGGLLAVSEQPKAWAVTAVLAVVAAVGARATLRWRRVPVLAAVAVLAVLPPLVTGHGSADTGHDIAEAALVLHVPAALLWLGTATVALRRRTGPRDDTALRAYHRLATTCWLLLLGSGILAAAALAPTLTSGYAGVLGVKVVVAVALGVAGYRVRKTTLSPLNAGRGRWLAAEALTLVGLLALSVDLSHLPVTGRAVSTAQALLGYDLGGPPTVARLAGDWRFDVVFGTVAVLAAGWYLARHRGNRGRTAAWLTGCALLLVVTSSGVGRYAAAMFSVHIGAHMVLSMVIPALLVLGAPRRGPTVHPAVATVLFAGAPFALYFTGLFDAAVRYHWAHLLIDAVFLVLGYLFFEPVLGNGKLPNLARVGMLLAAMPADVVFGAALIGTHRVIGNGTAAANFYQALRLPWVDLLADQRLAGILALALGELALLGVLAVLLLRWPAVDTASLPEMPQPQRVGHHEQ